MSLLNQQNNKGKKKGNKKANLANNQGSKFIQKPKATGFVSKQTNTGSQSMAALTIEGRLIKNGSEEIRRAQLDYLPSRSKNYVGFFFTSDPRTGTLQFQPSGYQQP